MTKQTRTERVGDDSVELNDTGRVSHSVQELDLVAVFAYLMHFLRCLRHGRYRGENILITWDRSCPYHIKIVTDMLLDSNLSLEKDRATIAAHVVQKLLLLFENWAA